MPLCRHQQIKAWEEIQAIPKSHWHRLRFSQRQMQPVATALVPTQPCPKSTRRIPASASYLEAKHDSDLSGDHRFVQGPWVCLLGPRTRRSATLWDARGSASTERVKDALETGPKGLHGVYLGGICCLQAQNASLDSTDTL